MSKAKPERNKFITDLRDRKIDGRQWTFRAIADHPKVGITEKNVRKIYFREKAKTEGVAHA